ncbi:MAG: PKD domain-containing protein, partial [Chitinophagaceae bacterium]|nr:PKD domain-containing protein [Chitinophagaceae bacterium]
MKNLLLLTLLSLFGVSANAQLSCSTVNASMSTSVSGGTVTLTNNSTPTSTSNIYTFYNINWGDNSSTYTSSNSAVTHTYNTSGTYTITLYQQVLDSINNITCYDTATTTISVTTSLNCSNVHAAMQVYRSGNNLGVLNNYSIPNAGPGIGVSYHIVWGDGNTTTTSSKSQQTHSYTSGGTFYVKLYLTVYDSVNNITCSDTATDSVTIPTSGGGLKCSSVSAIFSKSVSGAVVTVYNSSTPNAGSGVTASYKWIWGDGSSTTTSSKAARSHTYTSTGNYTISLIATYSTSSLTCTDSTWDTVYVNTTPPNKISGGIIVDSNSSNKADTFKVWLITFDSATSILSAVDSQIVSGYSYIPYTFNNKSAGQYRTKAHHLNGPSSGNGYVPTYHDSDLLWSNA